MFEDITPKEAVALQKKLRDEVRLVPLAKAVRLIGGCDVSMDRFAKEGFAGFLTFSYPGLSLKDESVVRADIRFPYIPGLLSFREMPMLLKAWERLKTKPDLLLVDGVGIAHPRRLGIASHLGIVLGIPTIGCGKSVLTGTYKEPGSEPGSLAYLYDKGEIIGAALRTKARAKPMFISPGHRITLEESIDIVKRCVTTYRLPEPTRRAHLAVNASRVAAKATDSL